MWLWGTCARLYISALVGALLLLILGVFLLSTQHSAPDMSQMPGGQPTLPTMPLTVGGTTLVVEVARTPEQEARGLSGRSTLGEGTGMLFIFDPIQAPGFWMKDMRFPLDIIFAKADGTIVTIHPNVAPATYPESFRPSEPVRYVLEVSAGFVAAHGIAEGQKIVVQ